MKNKNFYHHNNKHVPVLLGPTLDLLAPQAGDSYLDLTAGYGGHARAVLEMTKSPGSMVLVDRDQEAIKQLADLGRQGAEIIHSDYLSALERLKADKRQFDLILADLGISSPHIDTAERGFSFNHDGPLDMRMDRRQSLTADMVVNQWSEEQLADVIAGYGEQPGASRIARAIVRARPIATTGQLAKAVASAVPKKGQRHPATRTFQAIRIAVNDELNQLKSALPLIVDLLSEGGRAAIISFHSLEDRLVKRDFKEESDSGYESRLKLLNKKAVRGDQDVNNPRAHSARLRAVCKIKTQKEGGS